MTPGPGLLVASLRLALLLQAGPRDADAMPGAGGRAPEIPGSRAVHVEASPEAAERARLLRAEAEDLRRRLVATRAESASLLGEQRRLDQESALRRVEAEEASALAEVEAALAASAAQRASGLQARAKALRQRVALIARALYVQGPDEPLRRALAGEAGAGEAGVVLARRHAELALDVSRSVAAAAGAAREARGRADAAAALRRTAVERAERARRGAAERQVALRQLAARARGDETAAAEREAAATEFLAAVSRPPAAARWRSRGGSGEAPVTLEGLGARRGRLPWPIASRPRVLEAFGQVLDPRRGTRTLRHGVTLGAPRGEPILAIAPGRVVFVDWYKGFGRCLVLDHGAGFLSVMGHADELLVEPGDVVAEGEVVGSVGDTGSLDGPRLWFQIQRAGEPVDPLPWLAR